MLNRRDFLKLAAGMSAAFGFNEFPPPVKAAIKRIKPDTIPQIIYLQGLSCTGCSISLLQEAIPSPLTLLTKYSQLSFHSDLSAASGKLALRILNEFISGNAGEYYLAMEGAVPEKMPDACKIGEKTLESYLKQASHTAKGFIAIGTCASFGGIPSSEGNLTGAVSLNDYFSNNDISSSIIKIPGCSVHPDWVWHTIIHLVKAGMPNLINGLPERFFSNKVHDICSRYHYFQEEIFATKLGDPGCLFKLGCLGPNAFADCPTRGWNGTAYSCIEANSPCVGCVSPEFAKRKDFPFYRINEKN